MRIRRAASLLLGVAPSAVCSSQPPRRNLSPLPPAHEGGPPPCVTNMAVMDLMDQLGISDPQDDENFKETYFRGGRPSRRPWGSSCHFPTTMCAGFIEEENEKMVVDMVDDIILESHVVDKNSEKTKSTTTTGEEEKNKSKPKTTRKGKEKVEEDESDVAGGGWPCKKNTNKRWFCGWPASRPNSYCCHHSDHKPNAISKPPHRKRITVDLDMGFDYYDGFGPSRNTKRQHISNSVMESAPAEQRNEEALSEEHNATPHEEDVDFITGIVGADDTDHQVTPTSKWVDELMRDNYTDVVIDGCFEDSSDDDVHDCNGKTVKVSKTPSKKKARKPVKARLLKSIM